jgi:hypothetical protein
MKKTFTVALLSLGIIILFQAPAIVSAMTQESAPTARAAAIGTKICEKFQERVDNRIQMFDQRKRAHIMSYNNLVERIKKFNVKLEEKGYDTQKLSEDLTALNDMNIQFATDYSVYIGKLREISSADCENKEEIKAKIAEAKTLLTTVHEDAKAIMDFRKSVIKTDLTNLKKK